MNTENLVRVGFHEFRCPLLSCDPLYLIAPERRFMGIQLSHYYEHFGQEFYGTLRRLRPWQRAARYRV